MNHRPNNNANTLKILEESMSKNDFWTRWQKALIIKRKGKLNFIKIFWSLKDTVNKMEIHDTTNEILSRYICNKGLIQNT